MIRKTHHKAVGLECPDSGGSGAAVPADVQDSVNFHHQTVLLEEVTKFLAPAPGRRYADLTLGGGGHSERLLAAGASVLGLDRDSAALTAARLRLHGYGTRLRCVQSNFARFGAVVEQLGEAPFDGILLDLGVSSHQLDTPDRGFSFMRDGPLDMRMGRDEGITAADIVNGADEEFLVRTFREFGEEPQARRAARAIVAGRLRKEFSTTRELADCLEQALGRRGGHHPGTRIFQALRIAVNGELAALERLLADAAGLLAPGGRLAVISFHSLEDRITKRHFRSMSQEMLDRPEWPAARPNPDCIYRELTRKAVEPSPEEVAANPRARSAKLRVVEKLKKHNTQ